MKSIFLDTSSLIKIYHVEEGTNELMNLFSEGKIGQVYLSSVTKVEFYSSLWKKIRMGEITLVQMEKFIKQFESDYTKYNWIEDTELIKSSAIMLLNKYGSKEGLRTLDSIQLATAITLKLVVKLFKTSDKILLKLFELEKLPT